jgi:hypothetical protein
MNPTKTNETTAHDVCACCGAGGYTYAPRTTAKDVAVTILCPILLLAIAIPVAWATEQWMERAGERFVNHMMIWHEPLKSYGGSYPAPAIILKDRAILTFFSAKRRSSKIEKEFIAAASRTNADRTSLEAPVKVVDSLDVAEPQLSNVECGGFFFRPLAHTTRNMTRSITLIQMYGEEAVIFS